MQGTTQADYFRGVVPVTRAIRSDDIAQAYERNTGLVIVEALREGGISPEDVSAVLVANHGPFVWAPIPSMPSSARGWSSSHAWMSGRG